MSAEKPKNESPANTFELAPLSNRFGALIIDNIILGIISGILGGITNRGDVGFITYFFLQTGYQWYFLLYRDGQTPGKSAAHIRVVKTDGTSLRGADAVLRSIGYLINNAILGIGWLWALFDSNYQGLHDKLAKTYVVKE
ncbi:MAG: RDD family protein [Anaerolineae bacterium]